ncbi:M28 family peptidase [Flammeovirga agarivorans]|uniref:M28 family peptidase n=1 Tax=Flammeovirga agarivorans TaxID=2726742 RepID=A0A7X8SQX6_9BACT|nr:M28 family peptidase [Flammeovirga agarivorans]NLR94770.1 M28 family peptidase [Flammeovirga agarivorans]
MIKTKMIIAALCCFALFSCGEGSSDNTSTEAVVKDNPIPVFNADSAYSYVQKQVDFGPRVPNTMAHDMCGAYIANELERFGAIVTEQPLMVTAYNGTTLNGKNIIGSINPDAKTRIILAAHWDTRHVSDQDEDASVHNQPVMGANDGGSGVGVLLEVARAINSFSTKPNIGVDIIFFDVEDYGRPAFEEDQSGDSGYCLGSKYWAANPHKEGYQAYYGILLDMVGAKNPTFLREGVSMYFAPRIVKKVWKTAERKGFGSMFLKQNGPQLTDDHLYVNEIAKIPMIDIIDLDPTGQHTFFEHWHTQDDTMENIDKKSLEAVGVTLLQVLYNE